MYTHIINCNDGDGTVGTHVVVNGVTVDNYIIVLLCSVSYCLCVSLHWVTIAIVTCICV